MLKNDRAKVSGLKVSKKDPLGSASLLNIHWKQQAVIYFRR